MFVSSKLAYAWLLDVIMLDLFDMVSELFMLPTQLDQIQHRTKLAGPFNDCLKADVWWTLGSDMKRKQRYQMLQQD